MPSPGVSEIPSFGQELPDSPSASSPSSASHLQQTFLERIAGLPMVRASVARVQEVYRATKERHDLIRGVLESGESTLNSSVARATGILQQSGLVERLQKPLSLAESSACFVLDKVEAKFPIITKSKYEIKLMITENVDAKKDQFEALKESTVRLCDGYKSWGTQTIEEARQIGEEKLKAGLDTPVGQKINQTIERGLTIADHAVDRFLPEDEDSYAKYRNGKSNGHACSNGSANAGTFDHAKSLTRKLKRRVSTKTSDVVDSVLHNPAVSGVVDVAAKNLSYVQQTASILYGQIAEVTGKVVDVWYSITLFLLPQPVHDKFAAVVNGVVDKLLTYRHGSSS